jgi:hypothetical protein
VKTGRVEEGTAGCAAQREATETGKRETQGGEVASLLGHAPEDTVSLFPGGAHILALPFPT